MFIERHGWLAGVVVAIAATMPASAQQPPARAGVGPGTFASVLAPGAGVKLATVQRYELDREPVTNAQFLAFVQAHPEWQKGRVARLFAEPTYLSQWAGPTALGDNVRPGQPVTQVSWYAARAYCQSQGARLPTWYEWEYAAAADETRTDARQDPAWKERILNWYAETSTGSLPDVGRTPANVYGVKDLHGLVWEWVEDYTSLMVSSDSRNQGDPDKLKFCGASALSAEKRDEYAVLMRVAMLSALEANYTTANLGFRCASGGETP